eukprot:GEZU01005108.1.p1 GENE.GEZU01005108.1~~GEZU01005108.1.p1  ORF type:complete len:171 (+),score=30.21 GEZU01005108.1:64-576(+)
MDNDEIIRTNNNSEVEGANTNNEESDNDDDFMEEPVPATSAPPSTASLLGLGTPVADALSSSSSFSSATSPAATPNVEQHEQEQAEEAYSPIESLNEIEDKILALLETASSVILALRSEDHASASAGVQSYLKNLNVSFDLFATCSANGGRGNLNCNRLFANTLANRRSS